jgi:hypothetical protein
VRHFDEEPDKKKHVEGPAAEHVWQDSSACAARQNNSPNATYKTICNQELSKVKKIDIENKGFFPKIKTGEKKNIFIQGFFDGYLRGAKLQNCSFSHSRRKG